MYLFPSADTLGPLRALWTPWTGPIGPQILISICGHFGPSADTLEPLDGSNMSGDTYFHLRTLWTLRGHFGPFGWVQYVRRYLFPSADICYPLDGSNMSADSYFHLRTFLILWMGPICPQIHTGSLINRYIVLQI